MDRRNQKRFRFDSMLVDRLVDLAVEEVLKDQALLPSDPEQKRDWIDVGLPGLLEEINRNHRIVPPEDLDLEPGSFFMKWARGTFQDRLAERTSK